MAMSSDIFYWKGKPITIDNITEELLLEIGHYINSLHNRIEDLITNAREGEIVRKYG